MTTEMPERSQSFPQQRTRRQRMALSLTVIAIVAVILAGSGILAAHLGILFGTTAPFPPGQVHEFPIPTTGSGSTGISLGPDGALWFTENSGNQIGRITTSGQIREFLIPAADSHPDGITLGPDRALWFTEFAGNRIGRISP
jgi:streptogramin lyase